MKYIRASRKLNFSFKKHQLPWEGVLDFNKHYFASGREALVAYIRANHLEGKKILLPAYVPEGIIAPFKIHQCEIFLYDLDPALNPDLEHFRKIIQKHDIAVAVVIHYFGIFVNIAPAQKLCKANDCLLVEDHAHFFPNHNSPAGKCGDLILYSFPKIIGVPDGALLMVNKEVSTATFKHQFDWRWAYYVFEQMLRLLIVNLTSFNNIPAVVQSKTEQLVGGVFNSYKTLMSYFHKPNKMSYISKKLLYLIDYKQLIKKRTIAFQQYHNKLDDSKFQKLEIHQIHEHAYFGYPVLVNDRRDFIVKMHHQGIRIMTLHYKWDFFKTSEKGKYPNAYHFMHHHVIFPVSEHLSKKDIEKVIIAANNIANG